MRVRSSIHSFIYSFICVGISALTWPVQTARQSAVSKFAPRKLTLRNVRVLTPSQCVTRCKRHQVVVSQKFSLFLSLSLSLELSNSRIGVPTWHTSTLEIDNSDSSCSFLLKSTGIHRGIQKELPRYKLLFLPLLAAASSLHTYCASTARHSSTNITPFRDKDDSRSGYF